MKGHFFYSKKKKGGGNPMSKICSILSLFGKGRKDVAWGGRPHHLIFKYKLAIPSGRGEKKRRERGFRE